MNMPDNKVKTLLYFAQKRGNRPYCLATKVSLLPPFWCNKLSK